MNYREIDRLITENIFGNKTTWWNDHVPNKRQTDIPIIVDDDGGHRQIPRYSLNIEYAWKVVEKARENYFETSIDVGEDMVNVEITTTINNPKKVYCAYQEEKAPLAICKAALLIHGIEVDIDDQ